MLIFHAMDALSLQWLILILFGVIFFLVSPLSNTTVSFYKAGSKSGKLPGVFMLTSSLVIAWIFAKSITNAANLGLSYGIIGSLSYAGYYFSFLVGGIVIYNLRIKGGFESIHHFLRSVYGSGAIKIFSVLICFRLYNEVWSNTMVIGSYFGEEGSMQYYTAIIVFTTLTLLYTLKGGMRSSLITDAIQMILFGVLLFILLSFILPQDEHKLVDYINTGDWSMAGGLSLLFTVVIQIFSYPFHDPVLTDRGFISSPKTTLKSFVWATVIGFLCIFLFGFIGIFAGFKGLEGQASVEVSKLMGTGIMLLINLIMVTSAASTLDSTFSSFSKLIAIDIGRVKMNEVKTGRLFMALLALLGTIPVFLKASILSATTISGTMVIGLAPVFIFWKLKAPKISFHLSVWAGVAAGLIFALGLFPESLILFDDKYGDLLSVNLIGSIACLVLFFIPLISTYGKAKAHKTAR